MKISNSVAKRHLLHMRKKTEACTTNRHKKCAELKGLESSKIIMDLVGLAFVALFYLVILVGGLWMARQKGLFEPDSWEEIVLAKRELGLCLGIFTLIATEVGGAFVNGTAEEVFNRGLLWCQAPIGYSLSMTINGLFIVPKLRAKKYVTCIDSLQDAYGQTMGGLIYLPSCIGDICWTAAVLSALGSSLSIILDLDVRVSIIGSALIAIIYTLCGGMYSVAFTDMIQITFIFGGLWLAIPFMVTAQGVNIQDLSINDWTGEIHDKEWITYIDGFLLILCGGIPWQPYHQRALAMTSTKRAQILSVISTIGCLTLMIPPVMIGGIAKATNATLYPQISFESNPSNILPESLYHLTPYWVSVFGLSAISAAAMSSVDSSLLSGASYLTHNIYSGIYRKSHQSSKSDNVKVFRISVLVLGFCSTLLSLSTSTIYGLWILAGDLGYVVVFPQFIGSVYFPEKLSSCGSLTAGMVSIVLRLLIGEEMIGLPPVLDTSNVFFPIKTLLMLISLLALIVTSKLTKKVSQQMK